MATLPQGQSPKIMGKARQNRPKGSRRPPGTSGGGGEVLFGYHPVWEALRAGRRKIETLMLTGEKNSPRHAQIERMAQKQGILIRRVLANELEKHSHGQVHQGIGAMVAAYPLAGLDEMVAAARNQPGGAFLLLLDGITDPRNLGAMLRTALCVGVHGVVIPKDRSAPPTPTVSKASAGALEHIRLGRVTNMVHAIRELKQKGLWIAGSDMSVSASLFDQDLSGPLALVIGGEEKGIRPLVKKHCDFLVSIPQVGPLNSLNASVAAAVVLYEAFRQKRGNRP